MKKFLLFILALNISSLLYGQKINDSTLEVIPYLGASLGYTTTSIDKEISPTFTANLSDSSPIYGVQAGILADDFRIELAFQGRGLLKDSVSYSGQKIDFEMDTKLYFLNFIAQPADIKLNNISPYFGFGLGQARSEATVKIGGLSWEDSDSDSSAALACYAGLTVEADPNILLDFGADLYTFKAFKETITNVSPHIGIRFLLTQNIL